MVDNMRWIRYVMLLLSVFNVTAIVWEEYGADGELFIAYKPDINITHNHPTDAPTAHPTHKPTVYITKPPTLKPTHHPTNIPTKYPTTKPTHHPTDFPTNHSSIKPTHYATTSPTNNPTDAPTIAWANIPQSNAKSTTKKKKTITDLDDSLLDHLNRDTIEFYAVNLPNTKSHCQFEQYLTKQPYDLIIIYIRDAVEILPEHVDKVMPMFNDKDSNFNYFQSVLGEVKDPSIMDRDWCTQFLSTSLHYLSALDHTIFDQIMSNLLPYHNITLHRVSTLHFYSVKYNTESQAIDLPDIGPMTDHTAHYVFDFLMHSIYATFWHKFKDLMKTIFSTEYGKSDKFPSDLQLRDEEKWKQFKHIAQYKTAVLLRDYMNHVRKRYWAPLSVDLDDMKWIDSMHGELASFMNAFNYIKCRIDMGRIIYDWRYKERNHGSIAIAALALNNKGLSEDRVFNALGYNRTSIRKWSVEGKSTTKGIKSQSTWAINAVADKIEFVFAPNMKNVSAQPPKPKPSAKKGKKKASKVSRLVSLDPFKSKDIIKFHFVDPKYLAFYEMKLVTESTQSSDLLLLRAFRLKPSTWKTKDGQYLKIKPLYETHDVLFDAVCAFVNTISTPILPYGYYSAWIADVVGILSQYFAPSSFLKIYATLNATYPNKTTSQQTFMQYMHNCYVASEYQLENKQGMEALLTSKKSVNERVFANPSVVSMILDFFELTMRMSFELKVNAVHKVLEESDYIQNSKIKDVKSAWNMPRDKTHMVYERIGAIVQSAREWLVLNQSDYRRTNVNAGVLEAVLYDFTLWKTFLDIASAVYEWKYVDKLTDRDVIIVLMDDHTRALDEALVQMGYQNNARIKRFHVICTGMRKEDKYKEVNDACALGFKVIPIRDSVFHL
eukprot:824484_1